MTSKAQELAEYLGRVYAGPEGVIDPSNKRVFAAWQVFVGLIQEELFRVDKAAYMDWLMDLAELCGENELDLCPTSIWQAVEAEMALIDTV